MFNAIVRRHTAPHSTMPRLRVVVVTLEYDVESFSGNGILARGLARGLVEAGADVFVVAGQPAGCDSATVVEETTTASLTTARRVETRYVDVPRSRWFRLDLDGAHDAFATGAGEDEDLRVRVRAFDADACVCVDFSATACADALGDAMREGVPRALALFRVFSRSDARHEEVERRAVDGAGGIIALCSDDAHFATRTLGLKTKPTVMNPPLRADVAALAKRVMDAPTSRERRRRYLTCAVRASEEKEPHRFVAAVEAMAKAGAFSDGTLVPLLCVNENILKSSAYARELKSRFVACCPDARVVEKFLSPEELGEIFSETVLNVHPCRADAYGMTCVEAAAFGAPSAIHASSGAVGASEFLRPGIESIAVDVTASAEDFAEEICKVIADERTAAIARNAATRALEWDESAFGMALFNYLENLAAATGGTSAGTASTTM